MTIGEKIKVLRTEQGLTQKELGGMCEPKIHEVQIRKYERGEVQPKQQNAVKIALALGVPVSDLYGEAWETANYEGHTEHYPPFLKYLGSLGYQIYQESDKKPFGNVGIHFPNGGVIVVSPKGDEVSFTKDQFQQFEKAISDSVNYQIWQQQNRK